MCVLCLTPVPHTKPLRVVGQSRLFAAPGSSVRLPVAHMVCNQSPPVGDKVLCGRSLLLQPLSMCLALLLQPLSTCRAPLLLQPPSTCCSLLLQPLSTCRALLLIPPLSTVGHCCCFNHCQRVFALLLLQQLSIVGRALLPCTVHDFFVSLTQQ